MAVTAYTAHLYVTTSPRKAIVHTTSPRYGDIAIVLFLIAQCIDGAFTYVGVQAYGLAIEANPLVAMLMGYFGYGTGLATAKFVASALGIALYLRRVHTAVALLTAFYFGVAIVPWTAILFL